LRELCSFCSKPPVPVTAIVGFAPTSRAARQLKAAGIEAGTLQAFLVRGQDNERSPEQKRLFFIDESRLASTNQMREFLSRLGANDPLDHKM
jgi:hypothetical protein